VPVVDPAIKYRLQLPHSSALYPLDSMGSMAKDKPKFKNGSA
tara:strand:- start:567 stop:692 length:126 start_codon:yes stop_codon:yes gene_type:complete